MQKYAKMAPSSVIHSVAEMTAWGRWHNEPCHCSRTRRHNQSSFWRYWQSRMEWMRCLPRIGRSNCRLRRGAASERSPTDLRGYCSWYANCALEASCRAQQAVPSPHPGGWNHSWTAPSFLSSSFSVSKASASRYGRF